MSDASHAPDQPNPFPALDLVEIYDGTGRHLGGIFPPLLDGNVLTEACTLSKALRPGFRSLYLWPEDEHGELALVWMLPITMTIETPLPREIVAEVVYAVDSRKVVQMHGNDERVLDQVRALIARFVGGGHA
ncbi:hypothetical protein [Acidisphaera sp. L21]|uniref:hypothetical protein n=1 Tax=Acidisphaera sp. L21 TaxID=1641851 RepID=UPI00131C34D5|nr:hypothetical protein [Acidisphaera sp. L21]